MPELPDVTVYIEALAARVLERPLIETRVRGPMLLRTAVPPLSVLNGQAVRSLSRLGKRIVFGFDQERHLVLHLMIAGRLHWKAGGAAIPGKVGLAAFDFASGSLILTEASTHKRAALHVIEGKAALDALDPGGLEVLDADAEEFARALTSENRTLKRALTDPHILSGIGNAYSDEILHRAELSPVMLSQKLDRDALDRLFHATREVLTEWTERLRAQTGQDFPEKVTAFRPEMAVHGHYGHPCPVCQSKVQRIVYAKNETNYCPTCQTGGKLLADRALSKLLKRDWPKTPTELDERLGR